MCIVNAGNSCSLHLLQGSSPLIEVTSGPFLLVRSSHSEGLYYNFIEHVVNATSTHTSHDVAFTHSHYHNVAVV